MAGFSSRGPRLQERRAQARGRRPRRRRHRRPRRRHRARPDRRRGLHDDQRHLDGHPARGRPRRDPQAAAPDLGRRADQVGHRQQHRARRRTRPASTPAPAASTPWPPSTRTCSPRRRCRWAPTRGPTPTSRRRSTTLTYTNTGAAPVTLSLALTGEDGVGRADRLDDAGARHRSPSRPAAPPRWTVVLDPTVADPGAYSAVVTATPDDGGGTVRTGLAYLLEPERYDVKVTIKPRAGSQQRLPPARPQQLRRAVDLRAALLRRRPRRPERDVPAPAGHLLHRRHLLRPGRDGAKEGVVSYEPSFTVSKNTEIVLDENQTGRFGYKVDRPVVDDGAILDVGWTGDAGYTGFTVLRRRRPPLRAGPRPACRRDRDRGGQLAAQPARGPPHPRGPQAGGAAPAPRDRHDAHETRSPRSTAGSGSSTRAAQPTPRTSSRSRARWPSCPAPVPT